MTILVTGGAGFMGSNFIRYVLEKYPDDRVVNFDKLTYAGNRENLRDVERDPRYTFIQGDIVDDAAVERAMAEHTPDAILNYAAETHVDRSILDPDAFIRTEVYGTYTLLEAAKRHQTKRYVQISTDEVYGTVLEGETGEEAPLKPRSPYAASKAGADHLVQAYHVTFGLPTILTRSCNFYGPYQFPEKLIPFFTTNLIDGEQLPVYGDGQQFREYIHVDDHCSAIDALLHRGRIGETYNIGTRVRKTTLEIARLLLTAFGKDETMIKHVKDRAGHDRGYRPDSTKLRVELGWEPSVPFESGLQQTIDWYRNSEHWWRPLKSGDHLAYFKRQYAQR